MKSGILSLTAILVLLAASCRNPPASSQNETNQAPLSNQAPAAAAPEAPATAASKPAPVVRTIELPADAKVSVRLDQSLSSKRNQPGDHFEASLTEPVIVDGKEVLPKGTAFRGHVTESESSGRLKGTGSLAVTLDSFELNGATYDVATSIDSRTTEGHKKRNIEMIGGGAGLGALIGAIAGKGKGAAIGAAAGAGAGTATAAATGKEEAQIPAETVLRFTLKRSVAVKQ